MGERKGRRREQSRQQIEICLVAPKLGCATLTVARLWMVAQFHSSFCGRAHHVTVTGGL